MLRLTHILCATSRTILYKNPAYPLYIHLKDHNNKINPKQTKLNLSYMNPKVIAKQISPQQSSSAFSLRNRDQKILEKKIFEDYKQKILQGKIDEEEEATVDPLWGQQDMPTHYYKFLSNQQATWLTHSLMNDVAHTKNKMITQFFKCSNKITNLQQVKEINDYAQLAIYYRQNNDIDLKKWHQIEKGIGIQFHKLTLQSLLELKYACGQSPRRGSPEFHNILKDLLIEELPNIKPQELVHLFYANRLEKYRLRAYNLQIMILKSLEHHYKNFTLTQKIDWLFLFTDSRKGIVRTHSTDRYWNQKRDQGIKLLYNIKLLETQSQLQTFNSLPQEYLIKLVYSLVRMRVIKINNLVDNIVKKCINLLQEQNGISVEGYQLLFVYLSEIEGGKGITNKQLLQKLKDKVIQNWQEYSTINKLRALWAMHLQGFYSESAHELYRNIPMEVDNTILGYFSRLQFMNSSERQWQVIHLLAQLQELPISYYQDYKRFYNYIKATTEWDLTPIKDKLENTQIFINTNRNEGTSLDKDLYRNLKKYLEFSNSKLPNKFEIGVPIKNTEFVQFILPQYQISFDIATQVECLPGSTELKGSCLAKIKSLESLGWKHLYLFEDQLKAMNPLQFFGNLLEQATPYFESQKQVLESADAYRIYELQLLRNDRFWKQLQGQEVELWINDPEKAAQLMGKEDEDEDVENAPIKYDQDGDPI